MKRKTSAILAADVVGYAQLMGKDDAGTLALLKACEADVIEPVVARHNGRIFKRMGDGFLAEFDSAMDGVNCALDWQHRIQATDDGKLTFRIGVHLGQVIAEADDVYGDGVNVAARLEPLAQPGCIILSDNVVQQVRDDLDLQLDDLGQHELKNISQPVHVWEWRCKFAMPRRLEQAALRLPDKPSVVILPFRNLSGEAEYDYFAEGLRTDVQSALTQVSGVFLISMAAADEFRGAYAGEAGAGLGVKYALFGTLRSAGQRVRITAELRDTQTDSIVWAERFDRTLDDTFALQDEITAKLLAAMNVQLVAGEQARIWHRSLKSLKGLEYFYKGLDAFYQMNPDDMVIARQLFEKVAALEPQSALGPMQVAMCYWYELQKGWSDTIEQTKLLALRWAEEGATKEDEDGQGLTVLSHVHLMNKDYDSALAAGRAATVTRPGCANSNAFFANVLHHCDENDEAIQHIKLAMRFNPLNPPFFRNILSAAYLATDEFADAIAIARETVEYVPGNAGARLILIGAYTQSGQQQEAEAVAGEVKRLDASFSIARFVSGQFYKNPQYVDRLAGDLRTAGLPD